MISRFGGDKFLLRRRPTDSAFFNRVPKANLRNTILILVILFILRNLLRSDYRKEEINYLRDSSMSSEEIERIIPKTAEERMQYVRERGDDVERMKRDIVYLLNEVHTLRANAREPKAHNSLGGRESLLKEMDQIHLEKRKNREAQLLKDHPDFVPSRRVHSGEDISKKEVAE